MTDNIFQDFRRRIITYNITYRKLRISIIYISNNNKRLAYPFPAAHNKGDHSRNAKLQISRSGGSISGTGTGSTI